MKLSRRLIQFVRIGLLLNLLMSLLILLEMQGLSQSLQQLYQLPMVFFTLLVVILLILSLANGALVQSSLLYCSFLYCLIVSIGLARFEATRLSLEVWSFVNWLLLGLAALTLLKRLFEWLLQKLEDLIFAVFLDYH